MAGSKEDAAAPVADGAEQRPGQNTAVGAAGRPDEELLREWGRYLTAAGRSPHTIAGYLRDVCAFIRFFHL